MSNQTYNAVSLQTLDDVASDIVERLIFPSCVYLQGDLGAGKTTLCQKVLQKLGYQGPVTSPTYTLIQEYDVANGRVYHLDLYRLNDPAEVEYLGLSDLMSEESLFFIEWPDKGYGFLPPPNWLIELSDAGDNDGNERQIVLTDATNA